MSTQQPDPYAVLGVDPGAGPAEITTAYRRAVRACHPDTEHPDRERLAAVIAAYRQLRSHPRDTAAPREERPIPVRVRPPAREPDLRAGPVRHHVD